MVLEVTSAVTAARPAQARAAPPGLADFHPAVRTWFERRFPEGPSEPQAQGWPLIASGVDTPEQSFRPVYKKANSFPAGYNIHRFFKGANLS